MKRRFNIDKAATRRAIENAIRTQAQLVLESPAFGEVTVNGYLISGDESALLMEVTGSPSVPPKMLLNTPCTVVLYADQRYRFSTTITAAPKWGKSRSIAIARPERIEVIERRRFVRTTLAPSSRVRLSWETGSGPHQHAATLLNVSPRGLACRIEEGAAESIASGSCVFATFDLPSCECTFEIRSAVQSKTPASEGMVILGMHFEECDGNATHLAALRGMLERADEALLIQHEVTV